MNEIIITTIICISFILIVSIVCYTNYKNKIDADANKFYKIVNEINNKYDEMIRAINNKNYSTDAINTKLSYLRTSIDALNKTNKNKNSIGFSDNTL